MVSIKTGLTLGLIGAGALAFYALGGAKGIGSRIGGGFTGFGQSLADAFKFPEFVVEKSGGIQYDEKVLQGQSYTTPHYDKTLIIPKGTVSPEGVFRSDVPPMTEEYQEQFMQSVPNVDLPDTTSTPANPFPRVPSLSELFSGLRKDPQSQTSTPPPEEPIVFDKPQSQLQFNQEAAEKLGLINKPKIEPIGTSIIGGEFYGWGSPTGGGL